MPGTGVLSSGIGAEVVGSGTQFTTELHVGDRIIVGGQARIIQAITSDISLTTVGPFSPLLSGAVFSFEQPITRLADSTGTTQFMVNSLGNVGIGTVNPTVALHAFGNETRFRLQSTQSNIWTNTQYVTDAREWHTGVGGSAVTNGVNNKYYIADLSAAAFRFVVDPNGNVGIGTTNPTSKLDIAAQDGLAIRGFQPFYTLHDLNSNTRVRMQGLNGDINFQPNNIVVAGGGSAMIIKNNTNNVGIGTFFPAVKLDVAGPVRATQYLTGSDVRLKKNVAPLTDVLDRLEKVRGVSFEWNEPAEAIGHSSDRREIGVIAQEVEAVFPEVVTVTGEEGYKAVAYDKLTAVLIEAVKELKAENAALKLRLEALESK